ncbi:hypothetical protein EVJ58_g5121 [Rhodofomes roseus]|uniref:Uncharacterized protein n=1 Tax=Rhodofomes roseus TaxID=34475 RepID=A0A4Y9YGC8_9APHY|nr:hypothetical protein EVJ58_g5121 [Rhodofomes roseus]
MNGGENVSRRKVAPPRPALITPSASPPPSSRPLSLGWSNISADRPPPTKRRRLGSTPSSPFSVSTPTSSSVGPSDDIHESRKAASQRLLNTWAGLAERYNRPLDEDDIIDLRDGSIIKDRGVLRKVAKKFEMGCFAGDDVPSDTNDASSDYGGVHTDDDVDELDAFAPGADISGELELEREKRQVPPVQARNPADAEDLREFLEAERLRREQYGEDEDEDEVIQLMSLERTPSSRSSSEWRDSSVRDEPELEDNDSRVSEDEKDDLHDVPKRPPSPPFTRALAEDDESEDEFATWDFDTTTPVQPAKPTPRPPRPRTPDDVIDLTDSPESSPSRAPASRGRSRVPAPLASKQTEPARAKSVPRGRSRTRATPNTSVGSTKAQTPAKAPAQSKTAARRNGSMPPPPVPQRAIEQLVTPPPSSSSAIDSTPESTVAYTTKSPTPSPSPSPPPPPKTRPQPRPRYKGALLASGGTVPKSSQASPSVQNVEAVTPKAPRFKLVPEVVITSRPRSVKFPSRAPSPPPDTQEHTADAGGSHVRTEVSRKGKAKETSDPRQNIANETDRRHTQSSTKSASLPNVPITKRAVTLDANQEESDSEVPSPPPLPKVRKRKRVLSSLSLSETSDKDDPFPMVTPIVPSRPRLQDGPGPSSRRRTPKPVRKPSPRIDDDDSGTLHYFRMLADGILIMICATQTMLHWNPRRLRRHHAPVHRIGLCHRRPGTMEPLHHYPTHPDITTLTLRIRLLVVMTLKHR